MRRNPPRFLEAPSRLPPNLSFVLNISPSAMTLGLANMRALLDALGHPERAFRSVVVAGTNGKGSVTGLLSAVVGGNGRRVGWYSSPHIYDVTERVCVGNVPVSLDAMERAAAAIVPLYDRIRFSYFEALTAIAFLVFADRGAEICILETGLGGRFDATNVVDPVLTVLTGVALDHRRMLGDSEEEILREKLGITRPGVPLLAGGLTPALDAIVRARSDRERFPYYSLDELGDARVEGMTFQSTTMRLRTRRRDYGRVDLPLPGAHQAANGLLAVAAAEYLLGEVRDVGRALASVRLAGRFEAHEVRDKIVVLDVAHNDGALAAATRTLAALSPPHDNAMILGMLARKELRTFPVECSRSLRRIYLVDPLPGESLTAARLLERFGAAALRGRSVDVIVQGTLDTPERWDRMVGRVFDCPQRVVLVAGSFRTVAAFGRQLAVREALSAREVS